MVPTVKTPSESMSPPSDTSVVDTESALLSLPPSASPACGVLPHPANATAIVNTSNTAAFFIIRAPSLNTILFIVTSLCINTSL